MDSWRVAVLGDGGVGKTALAVQVSIPAVPHAWPSEIEPLSPLVYAQLLCWYVFMPPSLGHALKPAPPCCGVSQRLTTQR
ncbi:hypothetical protein BV20DRAFT_961579 [Pilatotrama ljubarskyi]|nr:hypothetical protein BV20DRAFT_961579 [Pilatotrama ljubarskyi]